MSKQQKTNKLDKRYETNRQLDKSNNLKSNYEWLIYSGLIVLLTIVVYANSVSNGFVNWDDPVWVVNNPHIKSLSINSIWSMFTIFSNSNYCPLTVLVHATEYHFFGLNPHAFHVVNLMLHIFNTLLVFYLMHLIFKRIELSVIVSVFFAIHPMHVESVVWITELKDVLYAFFFILSLIFYVKYINTKQNQVSSIKYHKQKTYYLLTFIFFILSLLAKSAAITLPVILILFDYYLKPINFKPSTINYWLNKLPFLLVSIVFGIFAIKAQAAEHAIADITPYFNIIDRFFLVCYSVMYYIIRFFLPVSLSALHFYPLGLKGGLPWEYYFAPVFIILIITGVVFSKDYRKLLLFGLLFFLVNISLVLQVIPIGQAIVAERYTYVPYIGLFLIVGKLYCDIADKKSKDKSQKSKIYNLQSIIFKGALLIVILIFSYASYARTKVWKDGITLFTDVVDKYPGIFFGYEVKGESEAEAKDYDNALKDYQACMSLYPAYVSPYFGTGMIYYVTNDYKQAIYYLSKAIEIKPDYKEAYIGRAKAYIKSGDFKAVMLDCNKAIELNPNDGEAYISRGIAKGGMGDFQASILDFNKGLELKPGMAEAYINRGIAKGTMKDYEGSIQDFNISIKLNPELVDAYRNRGLTEIFIGKKNEACEDFRIAFSKGEKNAGMLIEKYCK